MFIQETRKYQSPSGDVSTYLIIETTGDLIVFGVTEYKDGSISTGILTPDGFAEHITYAMGTDGWIAIEAEGDVAPTGRIEDFPEGDPRPSCS